MEFDYHVYTENDGEFSLYDAESGAFMSHYEILDDIIERMKADSRLDKFVYRAVVYGNSGIAGEVPAITKEIIVVPAL